MAPLVIDVTAADDQRDIVHRAVQALVEGKLVAFPLETVYVVAASALNEAAVARLAAACGRDGQAPLTLAVKSVSEAQDFVPQIPQLALRLARRVWPGPVTLELPDGSPDSALGRLPLSVRQAVAPQGQVRLRVPQHELISQVLRLLAGPLVVAAAKRADGPDPTTAADVVAQLGGDVDVVLDAGKSRFALPSSVVQVNDSGMQIIRPGAVSEANLKRLSSWMIVVVCTGNTCRSPMGEALLRQRLAQKVGCSLEELEQQGVVVMSAGVSASPGGRAANEAVGVMRERGLDLSQHESQPLVDRMVRFADLILAMTRSHRATILTNFPEAADRTHLVSKDRGDIADPIGGPLDQYRRCADQIDGYLETWVDDLNLDDRLGNNPAA